jgi:hypothetical protein
MAAAYHHFPKMDEKKNKHVQACIHRKGGEATGHRMGLLIPSMGRGNGTLLKPGSQPDSTPWA